MAIAIELAIALAALLVENEHLLTLNERRYYFAYYLGAFYSRSTYLYVAVVVNQQHVVKFNSLAVFGTADVVYIELLALFCFELLTVNLYDCVHLYYMYKRVFPGGGLHPQSLVWPQRTLNRLQMYCFFLKYKHLRIFFCVVGGVRAVFWAYWSLREQVFWAFALHYISFALTLQTKLKRRNAL